MPIDPFQALEAELFNMRCTRPNGDTVATWVVRGLLGALTILVRLLNTGLEMGEEYRTKMASALRAVADRLDGPTRS